MSLLLQALSDNPADNPVDKLVDRLLHLCLKLLQADPSAGATSQWCSSETSPRTKSWNTKQPIITAAERPLGSPPRGSTWWLMEVRINGGICARSLGPSAWAPHPVPVNTCANPPQLLSPLRSPRPTCDFGSIDKPDFATQITVELPFNNAPSKLVPKTVGSPRLVTTHVHFTKANDHSPASPHVIASLNFPAKTLPTPTSLQPFPPSHKSDLTESKQPNTLRPPIHPHSPCLLGTYPSSPSDAPSTYTSTLPLYHSPPHLSEITSALLTPALPPPPVDHTK